MVTNSPVLNGFALLIEGTDWDNRDWFKADFTNTEEGNTPYFGEGYELGNTVKLGDVDTNIVEIKFVKGESPSFAGYWVPMDTDPATFTAVWKTFDGGEESPQPYITPDSWFFQHDLCYAIAEFQHPR